MKNKNIIITGAVVLIGILLISKTGYLNSNSKKENSSQIASQDIQLVDAPSFSELARNQENFLLDVHTPEQTHIPGTDAFIPFDNISENIHQLPDDKSTPILVYCRSGGMSRSASQEIADLGYTNIYDLEGGINAYKESVAEVAIHPANQDLGRVIYGNVPTTNFTLTNFTPDSLKITRVSTSCGCTSAEVDNLELKAFESTTVKVSFDPAVHKDDTDLGNITRTIYIETNNSNFPQLEATIEATVIKN
jgi:rhodanese-related sulfurtransferase